MEDSDADRKLAKQLQDNGLAMSETHAREMANNINSTGDKVEKHFNENKDKATTNTGPNRYRDENAKEMRERAQKNDPVSVQTDYEVPGTGKDSTLKEIMAGGSEEKVEKAPEKVSEEPEEPVTSGARERLPEEDVDINDIFGS